VICYRVADYLTPLRASQAQRRPGRFHRGTEDEPTQYLCLHPLGPHAEAMRRFGTRTREAARRLDFRTWALKVPDAGLVDLEFDDRWVADDWAACQELGDMLRESGAPGLIAPSAALPGTKNVVLFGPFSASPYDVPFRSGEIPASITGEHGCALETLIGLVRFRGQRHPGRDFVFREPSWGYG
jgi:RES domain-containing protein